MTSFCGRSGHSQVNPTRSYLERLTSIKARQYWEYSWQLGILNPMPQTPITICYIKSEMPTTQAVRPPGPMLRVGMITQKEPKMFGSQSEIQLEAHHGPWRPMRRVSMRMWKESMQFWTHRGSWPVETIRGFSLRLRSRALAVENGYPQTNTSWSWSVFSKWHAHRGS